MFNIKHNKKRNAGLIFEFFSKYIGNCILENKDSNIAKAKLLLKKHFNPKTELYKELKLFKVLYEKKLDNKSEALQLLEKVKQAAKLQSESRLDLEKTSLIKDINISFLNEGFFDQEVTDYKVFATIQLLLNSWRSSELFESIDQTFDLEQKLIEHITTKIIEEKRITEKNTAEDIDRLVVNLMTEKINNNFGSFLNEEQKSIINYFVFSEFSKLTAALSDVKSNSIKLINEAKIEFMNDKFLIEKLNSLNSLLSNEYSNINSANEDIVSFYLGLVNLKQELKNVT